jgi:ferredoxin
MPYSHRGRRHTDGAESHPRPIGRFLEPCLLLHGHGREIHGYEPVDGHAFLDLDECIECGSCAAECPEGALVKVN